MPTVFLLDSQLPHRTELQERLVEEGYHALVLNDADETMQTLRCVRPDLLLVNVRAFKADAVRLLTKLRSQSTYAELPILFTGAGATERCEFKLSIGSGRIIPAGESLDNVMAAVRSYLAPLSEPFN